MSASICYHDKYDFDTRPSVIAQTVNKASSSSTLNEYIRFNSLDIAINALISQ